MKNSSEVAAFRQRQGLEEQAAQQGLSGLAIVARHESINKRMERGAERVLQLLREGKQEEAKALVMSNTLWEEVEV